MDPGFRRDDEKPYIPQRAIAAAISSRSAAKAETAMRKRLERVDQEFRSFATQNPKLVRKG